MRNSRAGRQRVGELELVAGSRIVSADAVDQDQHVVGLRSAYPQLRERSGAARLTDGEAGHGPQQLGKIPDLPTLDFFTRDDGQRARDILLGDGLQACCGHQYVFEIRIALGVVVSKGGRAWRQAQAQQYGRWSGASPQTLQRVCRSGASPRPVGKCVHGFLPAFSPERG